MLCSSTLSTEVKSEMVHLNINGTVVEKSNLPKCKSGEGIKILSSDYFTYESARKSLTPTAVRRIHEMCSLKDTCTNVSMPLTGAATDIINKVLVRFRCLGT